MRRTGLRAFSIVALCLSGCGGPSASPGDGGSGDDAPGDAAVDHAGERVFATDVLHTIEVTVAPQYLSTLDDDSSTERVPATIAFDGEVIAQVGLRKKGQTSRRPLSGKPGFTVKFNEIVSGQKLDGLKKLTLDNAVQDPAFVVGHISYELYRRAGLPAPRTSHATLAFNGQDKGIYVVEESTNADYLEAHFGNGDGNVYEGPWDFPKGVPAAVLRDEVSEMRTRDDLVALSGVVMNAPDATFPTQITAQLDLDQFITNYAVEMAAVLWDNYAYVAWNYYLYHVPQQRFVILTHGVNWPNYNAQADPFDIHTDPWGTGDPPGYLCDRIDRIPALAAKYRAELTRVARDAFDVTVLGARTDRLAQTLHARPLTGASLADRQSFDNSIGDARDFVRDRKAYLVTRLGL